MTNFKVVSAGAKELDILGKFAIPLTVEEALGLSIEKWTLIVKKLRENPDLFINDGGPDTCGLCQMFFDYYCDGCPVQKATGYSGCRATPYDNDWDGQSLLAAERELEFLESLTI